MNFSQFFISRPIFAAVLSLLILIAGAISLFQLPISEYPEVVPPTVVVRANFPGANPKVIGETVAAPLEQAITAWPGVATALPSFTHVLTHLDWTLHPLRWDVPTSTPKKQIADITASLPAGG